MTEHATIRVYYVPQTFPCGPQSSCCGPVGQTEAELKEYAARLGDAFPGVEMESIDASQPLKLGRDAAVIRLLNSFGQAACPIFAVAGEVLSVGPPALDELVGLVKAKLANQTA